MIEDPLTISFGNLHLAMPNLPGIYPERFGDLETVLKGRSNLKPLIWQTEKPEEIKAPCFIVLHLPGRCSLKDVLTFALTASAFPASASPLRTTLLRLCFTVLSSLLPEPT